MDATKMTGDDEGPDYDGYDDRSEYWRDRQSAVALLELELARSHRNPDPTAKIELPIPAARLVYEAAKLGLHKGQGKARPRDSHSVKLRKEAIFSWAEHRQRQLYTQGMKNSEAKQKAAEEAGDYGRERYGLSLATSTIKHKLRSL